MDEKVDVPESQVSGRRDEMTKTRKTIGDSGRRQWRDGVKRGVHG